MALRASRFRKFLPFAPCGVIVSQLETWRERTTSDLLDGPLIVEPPVKSARDADIPGIPLFARRVRHCVLAGC